MLYSNTQESRCCDRCFQLRQAFRGVTVQQTGSVSLSLSLVSLSLTDGGVRTGVRVELDQNTAHKFPLASWKYFPMMLW